MYGHNWIKDFGIWPLTCLNPGPQQHYKHRHKHNTGMSIIMNITSKYNQRLWSHFAFRKFHVTDSQSMGDQIMSDRRCTHAWSHCIMCIPFILLSGSRNECWLHTCHACVITTWRLGLRAPLVTCKKFMCQRGWPKHKHKNNIWFWYSCVYAYACMSKPPSALMQKLLLLMDHGPCYAYAYTCVTIEDYAMLILCLYLSPKVMTRL